MQRSGIFYILSGFISIGILLQLFYMYRVYELAPKYASNCKTNCQKNAIECKANFSILNENKNNCISNYCGYWDDELNVCFESTLEDGECKKPKYGIIVTYWSCFTIQVVLCLIFLIMAIYYTNKDLPIKIE